MTSFLAERMVTAGAQVDAAFTMAAAALLPPAVYGESLQRRLQLLPAGGLVYSYDNVRRWLYRRNCAQLAHLDVLLVPINLLNTHWAFYGIDARPHARTVAYHDSLSSGVDQLGPRRRAFHLGGVLSQWVQDEGRRAVADGHSSRMPGTPIPLQAAARMPLSAREQEVMVRPIMHPWMVAAAAKGLSSSSLLGLAGAGNRAGTNSEEDDSGADADADAKAVAFRLIKASHGQLQSNGDDCGVFTVENARCFLRYDSCSPGSNPRGPTIDSRMQTGAGHSDFCQADIPGIRRRIALEIVRAGSKGDGDGVRRVLREAGLQEMDEGAGLRAIATS